MSQEIFRRVHDLQRSLGHRSGPVPTYEQLEVAERSKHDAFVARCVGSYHRGSFVESPITGVLVMEQKSSKRRFVSYNRDNGDGTIVDEAAMIVAVHSDTCVTLVCWNEGGTCTTMRSVEHGTAAGQWSWPPRV